MDVNLRDFFRGKFVTAQDLEAGELVVQFHRWSREQLPLGGEKLVLWFRDGTNGGEERGLALNRTNSKRLSEVFSSEHLDDFLGKKVCLFRDDSVTGPGGRQGGVRVRPVGEGPAVQRGPPLRSEGWSESRGESWSEVDSEACGGTGEGSPSPQTPAEEK